MEEEIIHNISNTSIDFDPFDPELERIINVVGNIKQQVKENPDIVKDPDFLKSAVDTRQFCLEASFKNSKLAMDTLLQSELDKSIVITTEDGKQIKTKTEEVVIHYRTLAKDYYFHASAILNALLNVLRDD